jgi:hypothetical protein
MSGPEIAIELAAALLQSLRRSTMERRDRGRWVVSDFKGRHFGGEIVLWADGIVFPSWVWASDHRTVEITIG